MLVLFNYFIINLLQFYEIKEKIELNINNSILKGLWTTNYGLLNFNNYLNVNKVLNVWIISLMKDSTFVGQTFRLFVLFFIILLGWFYNENVKIIERKDSHDNCILYRTV